jgi:hypothetical protein
MKKRKAAGSKTARDSLRLGPAVIALRMAKLAKGDAAAKRESKRMVDYSAFDANAEAARGILSGRAHQVPGGTIAFYRKRVGNNLRRLLNG